MKDLTLIREMSHRLARQATGSNPFLGRGQVAQSQEAGFETQLIQLPVDTGGLNSPQTSGGAFVFMLGYSALGGPDALA